jgi:hypothetical protein
VNLRKDHYHIQNLTHPQCASEKTQFHYLSKHRPPGRVPAYLVLLTPFGGLGPKQPLLYNRTKPQKRPLKDQTALALSLPRARCFLSWKKAEGPAAAARKATTKVRDNF